ncbi:PGDYG domain-containing protein [Massilia sp. LXY-6]|uniref:PGDYG domain-containing protein n=1 Tax=Massilia sp. LXY-6 TaxID=3379823 RepID=UPI003EE25ED4
MIVDSSTDLAHTPGCVRVRKLPISVQVHWAAQPGVCQTREGAVAFAEGDPVLTGIEGERWTMPARRFLASYEPVPPLAPGADGAYRKRPVTIWAQRLAQAADVRVGYQHDLLHGEPGDWLVQYGPGDFGVVARAIFDKTYEVLGDATH